MALKIERVSLEDVRLDEHNARQHPARNLEAVQSSLDQFGQQKPIVVTHDGTVIAGNGTVLAARALGWQTIDVVRTDLTAERATAYAIADNRTSDMSHFDDIDLARLLVSIDKEIDIQTLGFDEDEIAKLLDKLDDVVIEPESVPQPDTDLIEFKFGDYSTMTSADVYRAFEARMLDRRACGVELIEDFLREQFDTEDQGVAR